MGRCVREADAFATRFSFASQSGALAAGRRIGAALAGQRHGVRVFSRRLRARGAARGVSGSLMAYALWHVVKAAFKRPEDSIEWTPAEYLLVQGGPFRRAELVGYRLMGVLTAAALKTGAFLLFMWPDLRLPLVALFGAFCGLAMLDLWRMAVEMAVFGVSDKAYQRFRWVTILLCGWTLAAAMVHTFCRPDVLQAVKSPGGISLIWRLGGSLNELRSTLAGRVFETPFWLFGQAVVADSWSPYTFAVILTLVVLLCSAAAGLVRWDAFWEEARRRRETQNYLKRAGATESSRTLASSKAGSTAKHLPAAPRGAAALAWRQLVGARQQAAGLAAAMAAPAILSLAPLYVSNRPMLTAINVMAASVFYSFLLLPSLLKFDFRRDLDRMLILKSLPLQPWRVVAAQITTPVLAALLFQLTVLGVAVVLRGLPAMTLLIGLALFIPLNCLMFSAENAIYLLYPYRLNEEGVEIFLRTTLVFTAKGIVFGIGAGLAFAWFMLSQHIAKSLDVAPQGLFMAGAWLAIVAASVATFGVLLWAYRRFDPAEDTPA